MVNDIAENMNMGKQTDVILLDFAKAFDKVPTHVFVISWVILGLMVPFFKWIKSFLTDRSQQLSYSKWRKKFYI